MVISKLPAIVLAVEHDSVVHVRVHTVITPLLNLLVRIIILTE